MSIDLSSIPMKRTCSQEQLQKQLAHAVSGLLWAQRQIMGNIKPADLVCDDSGSQRALEGGLRGSSGAKGKGAAALRDLSDSSIAVLPGNVNRSINNADPGLE